MSEIESEFTDARPETKRRTKSVGPSVAAGPGEGEDDLVFLDAAADSGLDIQVVAPAAPTSPKSPKKDIKSTSARMRTTSARHRVSGVHERVSLGATQDEWSRRDRSKDEREAALERLKAQVHAPPRDEAYAGRDLGPFKVKRFISLNRGASTYLAADEESPDPVMLRIFPFKGTYGPEFKALADRGERVTRVPSPFLNVVLASGRTKECFFVGGELPLGDTLEELLQKGESFDQSQVCSIVEQVARGLKVMHARELHHGGISLKTIRRERADVYVLEDAGICRAQPEFSFLSGGGEVVGEPGFIAPEAVDSGVGSSEADLYALGCVAWTLLAGRPPFAGDDPVQVLLDQLNGEVPSLLEANEGKEVRGISEGTATIIKKLTGYTATIRYRSV
ncbi:MAG: protein kinase, partial [Gemmatimonadales bacterium]|nr:protein kinase [Gemmatimonadales bacterium]